VVPLKGRDGVLPAVYVAPVSDLQDEDRQDVVSDLEQDAVVSDAKAEDVRLPDERRHPRRPWVVLERKEAPVERFLQVLRQ
jgi:hypothetical protein